jgi:polyisoprenoid-binding protein YceI
MTQPASGTRPNDAPAPGTYLLDPERTTVRADVKAMFGLTTVHGTFRLNAGQVVIAADTADSSVRASIDAASFASGHSVRDGHVVSAGLLDAGAYPEISFAGRGVRRDGADWIVTGSVTAHGTAQPVEVRVTDARMEAGTARFRAAARLDRTSFGVTGKKGTVGRAVNLIIEAVAHPAHP